MIHKGYNYIYINEYNDKDTDVLSYIILVIFSGDRQYMSLQAPCHPLKADSNS